MTQETTYNGFTADPETLQKIKDCLFNISVTQGKIEAFREDIKNAISDLKDETGLDKRIIRRLAKEYHKDTIKKSEEETDLVVSLFNKLFARQQ